MTDHDQWVLPDTYSAILRTLMEYLQLRLQVQVQNVAPPDVYVPTVRDQRVALTFINEGSMGDADARTYVAGLRRDLWRRNIREDLANSRWNYVSLPFKWVFNGSRMRSFKSFFTEKPQERLYSLSKAERKLNLDGDAEARFTTAASRYNKHSDALKSIYDQGRLSSLNKYLPPSESPGPVHQSPSVSRGSSGGRDASPRQSPDVPWSLWSDAARARGFYDDSKTWRPSQQSALLPPPHTAPPRYSPQNPATPVAPGR